MATRAAGHLQVVSSWLVFWALGGGGKSDGWKGRAEHDVTVGKVTTGRIAAVARELLDELAVSIEATFAELPGIERLATVGADVAASAQHLRQDADAGIVLPRGLGTGSSYRYYVLLLAHAVDPRFQRTVAATVSGHRGRTRSALVKAAKRMLVKYFLDYKDAEKPRDAMNCDICRNCVTFDTADDLAAGYAALCDVFGRPLQVKNSLRRDHDASEAFGYRCINVLFRYNPGITWGELIDGVPAEQSDALKILAEGAWVQVLQSASEPEFRSTPAAMICEVQLLLQPYLDLRKKSHPLYKVVRSTTARDWAALQQEFDQ